MSDTAWRIIDALARHGRSMTLRRRAGTTGSFTDVVVVGCPSQFSPAELIGELQQGQRLVTLSNIEIAAAGWPGPPRRGDILVIDGAATTVQESYPMYDGTLFLAHMLRVMG